MEATPANMEVYVRLAEANAAGEFELDSSVGSSLSHTDRFDRLGSSLKNHERQGGENVEASDSSGLVTESSSTGFAPISEVGQHQHQQHEQRQQAAGERRSRPSPGRGMPPVPLRRREAMSDVWQQQGAFRSNRMSMKSMFEEVREREDMNAPAAGGKGVRLFVCGWLEISFYVSPLGWFIM